ncbi:hypothetical protein ANN_25877 [Periplaneta americana]|uniref:Uncharacterized protein n=1 Tax=Periplaneta americana TaxID=6978 RepID=A0ABQ8S4S7_PERAM|nr:hypothetical protein ANN_25877 [Periplaneta americana]
MPCPSQASGFNVPNYIRKVQDNRRGLELNGEHQLLVYVYFLEYVYQENPETIRENTEILLEANKAIDLEPSAQCNDSSRYPLRAHFAEQLRKPRRYLVLGIEPRTSKIQVRNNKQYRTMILQSDTSHRRNGYIEGTELDGFLREFVSSANVTDVSPEVSTIT